jgi:hypothetical protein
MARIFHQDAKTLKEGSAVSNIAYMTTPGVHAPCGTNTIPNPLQNALCALHPSVSFTQILLLSL